jgi:hypothetical protein
LFVLACQIVMQDCVMEKKSEHAHLGLNPYTVAIMSSEQCSLVLLIMNSI